MQVTQVRTDPEIVFLGAGRPQRGDTHAALRETGGGASVLDWLLQAFATQQAGVQFIGGYQLREIRQRYPGFRYRENPDWEETRASGSLFLAEFPDSGALCATYSDVLYRASAVAALSQVEADVVVAVDSHWKDRYRGRPEADIEASEKVNLAGERVTRAGESITASQADAEFIGLVRFGPVAVALLGELRERVGREPELACEKLSTLVERLRVRGLEVRAVDLAGDWAELNEPQDLAHFVLGTKAETLARLHGMVRNSRIEDQVAFTVAEWEAQQRPLVERITEAFAGQAVVVRSSALSEDGFASANAGAYTSVLHVPVSDRDRLLAAIEEVIASYPDNNPANQVLVQPMVADVRASGVAFTRTLAHGAPWYVVNYDAASGSTESITNGTSRDHQTLVIRRDTEALPEDLPAVLSGLLPALREIEGLLGYDSLDVEFAVSGDNTVHILQVRPIAVDHSEWDLEDGALYALLAHAETHFRALQRPSPFVLGQKALFGVMPDWNPAEIIGTRPGRLAASLYRLLVMDDIWARQRAEYGYRDVRPQPLLVSFAGHPYVDVRASFNSFLPAALEDGLAERLVDFYLDWLVRHPQLHDKVEFEVVPTCFGLDFARWQRRLTEDGGFSAGEVEALRTALLEITREAFDRNATDMAAIEVLEQRCERLREADIPPLERAWLLLDDCRARGTLPFSHLARSAFVAVTLLRSAVHEGVIAQEDMDDFLNTIRSVSHTLTEDAHATATGKMAWPDFFEKYGHLRPGTYDISSPSYAVDPEAYLGPVVARAAEVPPTHAGAGERWGKVRGEFAAALGKAGLPDDIDRIETFMRGAIEGREYAKFAFTRNLSAALDALVAWGETHGVSREQLAHVSIDDLLALRTGTAVVADAGEWVRQRAAEGAAWVHQASAVELPPLITRAEDFSVFVYPGSEANFVGSGQVVAKCMDLSEAGAEKVELKGRIAMIPQADPGYDWLFGRDIAGLITMYGGANSHMAIRAAEFGLPAAIGVGETRYRALCGAEALDLNCANRQIHVVR